MLNANAMCSSRFATRAARADEQSGDRGPCERSTPPDTLQQVSRWIGSIRRHRTPRGDRGFHGIHRSRDGRGGRQFARQLNIVPGDRGVALTAAARGRPSRTIGLLGRRSLALTTRGLLRSRNVLSRREGRTGARRQQQRHGLTENHELEKECLHVSDLRRTQPCESSEPRPMDYIRRASNLQVDSPARRTATSGPAAGVAVRGIRLSCGCLAERPGRGRAFCSGFVLTGARIRAAGKAIRDPQLTLGDDSRRR
jgi:hypothetical protein